MIALWDCGKCGVRRGDIHQTGCNGKHELKPEPRRSIPAIRENLYRVSARIRSQFPYLAEELDVIITELRHVRRRQAHSQPKG